MFSKSLAVVTGANRGLGFEVARQLAEQDIHIVLTSRDLRKGEQALNHLLDRGLPVSFYPLDVTQMDQVIDLQTHLETAYGRLDILINNAAIYLDERDRLMDIPVHVMEKTLQTNFMGAYYMSRTLIPLMQQRNYGRVVNVSSNFGANQAMNARTGAYKLSKLALNGLTRILADEVKGNIKINAVCPGWVRTEMGGPSATRSPQEAAKGILWAAMLPDHGPTGGFFRDGQEIAW